MEGDASKAKWLLDRAYNAQNIFEARSWLLTARNTHPTLFSVQYAAYELGKCGKIDKNIELFTHFFTNFHT